MITSTFYHSVNVFASPPLQSKAGTAISEAIEKSYQVTSRARRAGRRGGGGRRLGGQVLLGGQRLEVPAQRS